MGTNQNYTYSFFFLSNCLKTCFLACRRILAVSLCHTMKRLKSLITMLWTDLWLQRADPSHPMDSLFPARSRETGCFVHFRAMISWPAPARGAAILFCPCTQALLPPLASWASPALERGGCGPSGSGAGARWRSPVHRGRTGKRPKGELDTLYLE